MWIPLNKPYLGTEELANVQKSLALGHLAADGSFSQELALALSEYIRAKYVYLTPSASSGMELALRSLDLRVGGEVIVPSFTMSSTANAVLAANLRPVFGDIEEVDLALDPKQVERLIGKKTVAIMVVHYGGRVGRIEELRRIAKEKQVPLIEDAACALGSFYEGRAAGTLGEMGVYSFHETKNVMCGEGGALVTDEDRLVSKVEIIRDHGTNRNEVLKGMASSYDWREWGGSFLMADILAAIVLAQLKKIQIINVMRLAVAENYYKGLQDLAEGGLVLPVRTIWTNWHTFYVLVPQKKRDRILRFLRDNGVGAAFHYLPLHSSPMGKRLGFKGKDCPVTERIAGSLIRLPIYPDLTQEEQEYVVEMVGKAVKKFL
jgi:dTDP-4-amino-4,6-dideoxygalactose transaminase